MEPNPDKIGIYMERNIFNSSLAVYLTKQAPDALYVGRISWEKQEERFPEIKEPTLIVDDESIFRKNSKPSKFIQTLLESMKNIGLLDKQPEVKMLEGELTATKEHLKDMQRLAFSEGVTVNREQGMQS